MKRVIINKIPLDEAGQLLIDPDTSEKIHKNIQSILGDDFIVITTPTEVYELGKCKEALRIGETTIKVDDVEELLKS